jgi:hypothetical protein
VTLTVDLLTGDAKRSPIGKKKRKEKKKENKERQILVRDHCPCSEQFSLRRLLSKENTVATALQWIAPL